MSELWDELCTFEALKDGWYLASRDLQQDFIKIPFLKEQFALSLDSNLNELVRQLKTEQFRHQNVIRTAVSKGNLSTRPGSFIPLESRIVLFAAIKLVANQVDKSLIEGVFSCRVKDSLNKKELKKGLFKESSLTFPPFIKNTTISRIIDPFEAWYGAWPAFEQASIDIGIDGDYPYLAISDISAYFENIQLEILRDQLFDLLPNEQQITNLFISAFAFWTAETPQGRQYMRGIPQGSDIPRFFGNLFLGPIDKSLDDVSETLGIKYYRYMDDVRIFAKTDGVAKAALLKFEEEVRGRHLNLQSAKTRVLRQKRSKEVSYLLIDSRLTDFNRLSDKLKKEKNQRSFNKEYYLSILSELRERKPDAPWLGEQKIKGAKKPLTGLSDRLFRRIVSTHIALDDRTIVPRLISEISRNSDQRYNRFIIKASQAFPRLSSLQSKLYAMMSDDDQPIAPSREADFLKAFRYQSRVSPKIVEHCKSRAIDNSQDPQVRLQSLALIARTKLDTKTIKQAEVIFDDEENILIKRAASLVLMSRKGDRNEKFTTSLVFHPNNELRKFGRYIHSCKTDLRTANGVLDQAFKNEFPWYLADYIPILFLQSQSSKDDIKNNLKNKILSQKYHKTHPNMDMRELLNLLLRRLN
jgi:hypothetical protein